MDRQDDLVAKSRKSNRWFLQHASDGILILDIEGNAVEASDSFCHLLGYNRAEVIGMNVTQWDAGFSPADLAGVVAELFDRPESQTFEARYRRKDGSVIDVEVTGRSLKLGGEPVLYLAARDITERKRAARKECSLFNFRHRLASGEERDVEVDAAPMDVDGACLPVTNAS
jgi:PAS domain S-box-containing protein